MTFPSRILFFCGALLCASSAEIWATVRTVPTAYSTIQDAISASDPSDEIVVTNVFPTGNHHYPPFLVDRAVSVYKNYSGEIVVEATGSDLYAAAMSDIGASISGLTLQGGQVCICDVWGGTLTNCKIQDNGQAFTSAGALVAAGGLVQGCIFELSSDGATAVKINAGSVSDPAAVLENTMIISVPSTMEAEGVLIQGSGAEVRRNTITFTGAHPEYGVGIYVPDSSGQQSKILSNWVRGGFSGIYVDMNQNTNVGDVQITSNTLEDCRQAIVGVYGKQYTINRNTIVGLGGYSPAFGVYFYGVNKNAWTEVKQNLIVATQYGFVFQADIGQTQWTVLHNGYYYQGPSPEPSDDPLGTSGLRTDLVPRFCEGRSGTQTYSHRVDSDYNPASTGAFNGDVVGVYGLECAFGDLQRIYNTVPSDSSVLMVEDVRIPGGKHLTVEAGATLKFDDTDESQNGVSSTKNELIVDGTLTVSGSASNPVSLESAKATPTAGDWNGIMVNHGASLIMEHAHVKDAAYAVQDSVDGPASMIDLGNVTLTHFQTAGIYCYPSLQSYDESGVVDLDSLTVVMDGAPYGLYFQHAPGYYRRAYTISIDDTSIQGDYAGTYGLHLDMQGVSGVGVESVITSFTVAGLTNGSGVFVKEFSPLLRNIDVSACQWGIQLQGGASPQLSPSVLDVPDISACTTGLYVKDCHPSVTDPVITDCQTGLYTDTGTGGTFTGLEISGGQTGFRAKSSTSHTFQGGSIVGFSTYGVLTNSGCGVNVSGNNIYSSGQGVSKYVRVNPYLSELGDVLAENNWWGEDPPPSSKFTVGVDYTPWSTQSYGGMYATPLTTPVQVESGLRASPNPSGDPVTFTVGLVESARLELTVFDIQGRIVRRFDIDGFKTGIHEIAWDGKDEVGQSVAAGLYFVRSRAGRESHVIRLVRISR